MRSKKKAENQLNFLVPSLKEKLNPNHELYFLDTELEKKGLKKYFSTQ